MSKLQIFKTGRHTPMSGNAIDFSDEIVKASVAAYDITKHQAPIVVGHPSIDAPAYGWIQSLSFSDGVMEAAPVDVDPQFAELVNQKKYKNISASFYGPDAPGNPVPGTYYLRHVGFLGATPPSVKGLKAASFSDAEEGVIQFGDYNDKIVARLFRSLRDYFIAQSGLDKADQVIPSWDLNALETEAAQIDNNTSSSYSDPNPHINPTQEDHSMSTLEQQQAALKKQQEELDAKQKALNEQSASFAERENAILKKEQEAHKLGCVEFCDGLVKSGKMLPVHKPFFVELMSALKANAPIEFGEGDNKQKVTPLDGLKDYLSKQPVQVNFLEVGKGDVEIANFGDPLAVAKEAQKYQDAQAKEGNVITTADAVAHVSKIAGKGAAQ